MSMTAEDTIRRVLNGRTVEEFEQDLAEYAASDDVLLDQARMREYPNRYVAVCRGAVVGSSHDLNELIGYLDTRSIPLKRTAIRFIEANGMAAA